MRLTIIRNIAPPTVEFAYQLANLPGFQAKKNLSFFQKKSIFWKLGLKLKQGESINIITATKEKLEVQ